ncbi:tetratricopeptide repeat protein [Magnetospirillum molischianum]|uniref:Predicted methyltransferase n=1 Tax=Magnetospirillum molischianum DSM 120 TaxID=1150626 RepID=H8FSE1_MAGML|nr:tetratricopeptide repeat protein [Magnetospirillum molischianum]CCG41279.1 Predicted methyltransferase [Magnetospirillum molischianum DSM 120]
MKTGSDRSTMTVGEEFAIAMKAWEAGDRAEARRLGRRLATRHPEFGGAHYLLGLIAQQQGQIAKAVEHLMRAVAADPRQPVPRLALGRALEAQGNLDAAGLHYRAVLDAIPTHAEAHARLGEILGRSGQRDEAIDHCRRAVAANPRHAEALCCLGSLLHEAGQSDEAAVFLERALELRPSWATALYNYGLVLIARDRLSAALTILTGAAELRPNHAATAAALAGALRRLNRLDEARSEAERATQLAAQDSAGWLELGLIRVAQNSHDGAAAAFERVVSIEPKSVQAHWCLAESRRALGQIDRAAIHYDICLRLDPADRVGAALGLAQVGAAAPPERAPDAYVRQLFDDYASHFESALVDGLGYCGPEQVGEILSRVLERREGLEILDAGCGTGLAAPVLRPLAARLDGLDISSGMVDRARRRGLYDSLEVGELIAGLSARQARYDVVAAADVLVYFGALGPLLAAAAQALKPGGVFACTLERCDDQDYRLGAGNRYAHSAGYVEAQAKACGFAVVLFEPAVSRREAGLDVPGWVAALRLTA